MHTYAWVYTRSGFHTRVCAKLCMVPHEWKQFRLLHRMTVFDNSPTNSDIHLQQLLNNCLEQLAPTTTFSNHLQQQHSATIFHSYLLPLPPTTTFNNCLRYIQLLPSTTTIFSEMRLVMKIMKTSRILPAHGGGGGSSPGLLSGQHASEL